jgi:potassium-transporting ATPase potassium-binding subunit
MPWFARTGSEETTVNPALTTGVAMLTLAALLALTHVPLGSWVHRVFTDDEDWRLERLIYRLVGVDPRSEQRWTGYAISVVAFSVVSVAGLFLLIEVQGWLPWSLGRSMDWHTAVNTAVSFMSNTNWQSYAGEAGTGYTVQAVGLTVQNFLSAAVGLAVAIALIRGLARQSTDLIGNFWVDLVRGIVRVLLPLALVAAVVLLAGGVIQNLTDPTTITTVTGGQQVVQGGAVASQEAIKELGTNGGGFFNANSAHPFENPNAWTNLFEIFLLLVIPFSLPYAYGRMVGNRRQGMVATATMAGLLATSMGLAAWAELGAAGGPLGSMEGKEQRFGIAWSSIFAGATTGTSTGAVNSMHDSFSALGGAVPLSNMMLGEVSPGGVGTGLYNLLVYVVLAVFIAGLMVGRTPELLGKTVGRREITYVALSVVVTPALVLIGTGLAIVLPAATAGLLNSGPHGLSEMLYAYTSASNNNGSAFAGLTADQPFLNLTLAFCMFVGRLVPIVLVLALAGAFAAQRRRPVTAGTMPTDTPLFTVLLAGTVVVVAGLTFFPALALGPIAEALS